MSVTAQETGPTEFNQQRKHSISLGFSITSFSNDMTYMFTPAYHFRTGRHQFMLCLNAGRSEALQGQTDIGPGLRYRLYPFKNKRDIRLFAQAGADYLFQDNKVRSARSILYHVGPGVEADLTEKLSIGANVDIGIATEIKAHSKNTELISAGANRDPRLLLLPYIRLTYSFGKKVLRN